MKTNQIILFLLLTCSAIACSKQPPKDDFCIKERQEYLTFSSTDGIVGYSDKYKRYVLIFKVLNTINIDESIVGFPCTLQNELQVIGKTVTLSGTLKKFQISENMQPEIAGQNLFYLELNNIKQK